MVKLNWLFIAFALIVAACSPMGTEEPTASLDQNASAAVFSYPAVIADLGADGTYTITSSVSWEGSTTTWVYNIVGSGGNPLKAISHASFAGFDNCFKPTSIVATSGTPGYGNEGNTGCADQGTPVLKVDGTSGTTLTITLTYDKALAVDESAASLYIKAATSCAGAVIPGAGCEVLKISGSATHVECDGTQTTEALPYAGVAVTATQGSTTLSTTTDGEGKYSFSNISGTWSVTIGSSAPQTVTVGPTSQVVNFAVDNRVNGSCAEITGSVERFDCNGTTSAQSLTGTVTLTGTGTTTYGDDTEAVAGAYSFSNVPVGTYSVSYAGKSVDVTIASESGSNEAAAISVDNRINSTCAAIVVTVDLNQCLNQSSTGAQPWSGATVTLSNGATATNNGNGTYTFSNVVDGTYSITVSGTDGSGNAVTETKSGFSVAGPSGVTNASFSFDTRIDGACGTSSDCSLSQGYWFAKPQSTWVNGLTMGAYTWTKAEGVAIWNSSNKGGLPNVKAGFTQAAAIILSGVERNAETAALWADVDLIVNYIGGLTTKLSATNIPKNSSANAAVGAAAGRIGQWIDANHCNETK